MTKLIAAVSAFLLLPSSCLAQQEKEVRSLHGGYYFVPPELVGRAEPVPAEVEAPTFVFVSAIVDSAGEVVRTSILRGVRPELDSLAVATVQEYELRPGREWGVPGAGPEGKPVETEMAFPVQFVPRRQQ